MNNADVIIRLDSSHAYFIARKDNLFEEIAHTKQILESIQTNILEKERYLEIQTKKEKDESNIFNLYDTTNHYAKNIKDLQVELASIYKDEKETKETLTLLEEELEEVTSHIISIQIMRRHFTQEESEIDNTQISEENAEKEEDSEKGKVKTVSEEFPILTTEDIIKRLQFCKDILDLDKARCSLELNMLIEDISSK